MKSGPVGAAEWAAGVAARLRLLQASFADESPETRARTLGDELEQALKSVTRGQRKEYMEALATEFPAPISGEQNGAAAGSQSAVTAEPQAPTVLVDRLVNAMQEMPQKERSQIVDRLVVTGFFPQSAAAKSEIPQELQERVQKLVPGRAVDNVRALRSLDILIDFVCGLDQLVWKVWKQIAPRSLIQHDSGKYSDIRKTLGPYITGDPEVSTEQLKQMVGKTRKLVAGLMMAMGTIDEIQASFLERLSPDAIRKKAEADRGVFESIEKKCWLKYTAVFSEKTRAGMEKEIFDTIKKSTEKLVFGDAAKTFEE
jgi:hypothetical protein